MTKYTVLGWITAGLLVGATYGQQARVVSATTTIPLHDTPANDGPQMFNNYCAPCHGVDGRGMGPAARSLRQRPTDLTQLRAQNGGKYPEAQVAATLEFGVQQRSKFSVHGSAQMPVWGPILGNMNHSHPEVRQLRVFNLSRYIETLQTQ